MDGIELDCYFVDLVLKLSRPVEILRVWFNKEDLTLKNTNIVKIFSVIVR